MECGIKMAVIHHDAILIHTRAAYAIEDSGTIPHVIGFERRDLSGAPLRRSRPSRARTRTLALYDQRLRREGYALFEWEGVTPRPLHSPYPRFLAPLGAPPAASARVTCMAALAAWFLPHRAHRSPRSLLQPRVSRRCASWRRGKRSDFELMLMFNIVAP